MRHILVAATFVMLFLTDTEALQRVLTPSGVGGATSHPIITDGWWFRVNTTRTKATKINWEIVALQSAMVIRDWWFHSGGVPEIWVRDNAIRHSISIDLHVTTEPMDSTWSVCALFNRNPVRLMEFVGESLQQLSSEQHDERCDATLPQ
jgi:hypothetical protein